MSLWDFLDNYICGPFNYIDRLEGLLRGLWYQDLGYRMAVLYPDRGGRHSRKQIEALLGRYGIVAYGRTHDADHMYFRVKKRQARWAEYILLHAGVALTSPSFDQRNPSYVEKHPPGWMPKPWTESTSQPDSDSPQTYNLEDSSPPSLAMRIKRFLSDW